MPFPLNRQTCGISQTKRLKAFGDGLILPAGTGIALKWWARIMITCACNCRAWMAWNSMGLCG